MERLEELGAAVIRADSVYHTLLLSNTDMLAELRVRFPETFAGPGGAFDRVRMRGIAFSDRQALADLNRITHPYVLGEVRREMARVFLKGEDTPIAIEAIALIGSGLDSLCSLKIAVTAPLETRLERIMARDGLTREETSERIRNQKPEEYYKSYCNIILNNNGTADELREGVDRLWEKHVKS
jgi:dephospho-CoA kinase